MILVDIIILVILAGFIWKGVRLGLIEAIGGIIGLFVGVYLAGIYYQEAGNMIQGLLFNSPVLANIIGFLLVFIIVNRFIALIFWLVDRLFHIIAIIPGLKSLNRLLGGIFGLIEGLIFIGIIVYVFSFFPLTDRLSEKVNNSKFASVFKTVGKISDPFIPDNLKDWKSNIPSLDDLPGIPDIPFGEIPDDLDFFNRNE